MARILIIGNQGIVRDRLKNSLTLDGHEVFTVEDCAEDPAVLDKEPPEIALVDMEAPGTNGIEILKILGESKLEEQELRRKLDAHARDLESKTRELEELNSELRKTTAQLFQCERLSAVGKLTAGVAHELNQPLTGINYFCRNALMQLEKGEADTASAAEVLGKIQAQVKRMSKIIKRLGIFGHQFDMAVQESDINAIIRDAVTLVGAQLKVEDVELAEQLCETCAPVNVDPNMLEQVVINLLTNAKDAVAGKSNPKVTLRSGTLDDGKKLFIEVEDNGHGIAEEQMDRLFEPFFTTKPQGTGTGLGLSICHGIVKDLKGDIEVESREGDGATFRVILPASTDRKTEADHD